MKLPALARLIAVGSMVGLNLILLLLAIGTWTDPSGGGPLMAAAAFAGLAVTIVLGLLAVHQPQSAGRWFIGLGLVVLGVLAANWLGGATPFDPVAVPILLLPLAAGLTLILAGRSQRSAAAPQPQ